MGRGGGGAARDGAAAALEGAGRARAGAARARARAERVAAVARLEGPAPRATAALLAQDPWPSARGNV